VHHEARSRALGAERKAEPLQVRPFDDVEIGCDDEPRMEIVVARDLGDCLGALDGIEDLDTGVSADPS